MSTDIGQLLVSTGEMLKLRGVLVTNVYIQDGYMIAMYLLPDTRAAICVTGRPISNSGFIFKAKIVNYHLAHEDLINGRSISQRATLRHFPELSNGCLVNDPFVLEQLLVEQVSDLVSGDSDLILGDYEELYSNNDNNL